MNVSVPCRLTCDPSGLNDCVNINTGILYSQVKMCDPIQFNIVLIFVPHFKLKEADPSCTNIFLMFF